MCKEIDDDPRVAAAMAQENPDVVAAVNQRLADAHQTGVDEFADPRANAAKADAEAAGFSIEVGDYVTQ